MTARITDLEGRLEAALVRVDSKQTARTKILQRLALATEPLPLHRLDLDGVSQAAASARLREMARDGIVQSHRVPGKKFTAWSIKEVSDYDMSQPFMRI